MRALTTRLFTLITTSLGVVALAACSPGAGQSAQSDGTEASSSPSISAADSIWPRTITHELGETTLDAKPERIVSTSISVTGTLLAIDAPIVASAATSVSSLTDDKGFFSQWASVADERGVDVLYDNLEFDMEALIAADPDLVIISTSGADSVVDQYDQIAAQFPTIVVDYSSESWQNLAAELGTATGLEDQASAAVDDFNAYTASAKEKITPREGGVSIVSFNGAGKDQGVGKVTGPHADIMTALGIDVVEAPEEYDTSETARSDFAFVTLENLPASVGGTSVFLLTGTDATVEAFESEPILANVPAVQSKQVYPLGPTSFRIDYYSGKLFVDAVVDALS